MSLKQELKKIPMPAIRLALVSLLICGLIFPLAVTGFAQLFFHDHANGSLAHLSSSNSTAIGSYLIAQNFSQPYFFHSRNSPLSASGVDPDILLADALAQVPRISVETGILQTDLTALVNQHVEGTLGFFGYPFVNVLSLNIALIHQYQNKYCPRGYCT